MSMRNRGNGCKPVGPQLSRAVSSPIEVSAPHPSTSSPLLSPGRHPADGTDVEMDDRSSGVTAVFTHRFSRGEQGNEDSTPANEMRCSRSALLGVIIWLCIGGCVLWKLNYSKQHSVEETETPVTATVLPVECMGDYCLKDGGSEAFGTILGVHNNVFGFSNCYSHTCISMMSNEISVNVRRPNGTAELKKMHSGMKWQCVEYARRYWILAGTPVQATFGDVNGAADIWTELQTATLLGDGSETPLIKLQNGASIADGGGRPHAGDLLIYLRDEKGIAPYGHVSVIVGVEVPAAAEGEGLVYVAEQNWVSLPWPEPYHNYSRTIPMRVSGSALQRRYTVVDEHLPVTGWVRFTKFNEEVGE